MASQKKEFYRSLFFANQAHRQARKAKEENDTLRYEANMSAFRLYTSVAKKLYVPRERMPDIIDLDVAVESDLRFLLPPDVAEHN